jgi:predicted DNA-binding transcriptional regulator AlpA
MNQLPQVGYLREKQILGDKKAKPPTPPIIPVSHSSWWSGVKAGKYPQPVKLGPRTTVWTVDSIRKLIENPSACCDSRKPSVIELTEQA